MYHGNSMRVTAAFQGEPGAFSFIAAHKLLGGNVDCRPLETFGQVFDSVNTGSVKFGVIPIENTLYGSVHENYDHLLNFNIEILGETTLRIEHALISRPECELPDIRRAYSHPVALEQCRQFFLDHALIRPVPYYDTAGSVKMLMSESHRDVAAIASSSAAGLYNAKVLLHGIEDNPRNFTRFFLLTKQGSGDGLPAPVTGDWKTSLVFTTANFPGSLSQALMCFSTRNVNLTKLESRPLRETPWEYLFYVDIAGAADDARIMSALEEMKELTSFFKILGSYCPTI